MNNKLFISALIIGALLIVVGVSFFSNSDNNKTLNAGRGVEIVGNSDEDADVVIDYFWSITCPYCLEQNKFWEDFISQYPAVSLRKYQIDRNSANIKYLQEMATANGADRFAGTVPITFINGEFFVGFSGPQGTGREIEEAVLNLISALDQIEDKDINEEENEENNQEEGEEELVN